MVDRKAVLLIFRQNKYISPKKKITPGFEDNVDHWGNFFVSWVNKYIIVYLFASLEKFFRQLWCDASSSLSFFDQTALSL